jgi:hypothetical protein
MIQQALMPEEDQSRFARTLTAQAVTRPDYIEYNIFIVNVHVRINVARRCAHPEGLQYCEQLHQLASRYVLRARVRTAHPVLHENCA